jgi:hypothetical protein
MEQTPSWGRRRVKLQCGLHQESQEPGPDKKKYRAPMVYLKFTNDDFATLDVSALYTEIDDDGWVRRELGVGADGVVEHQIVPSIEQPGWFGLARLSQAMLESNVTRQEFELLWEQGELSPG